MADLKEFDEKRLLREITWASSQAQASVERTAQSILEEIREVVNAQALMPKRLDDLLASAYAFWVKEFVLDANTRDGIPMRDVKISIANWGAQLTPFSNQDFDNREPRCLVAGKRYRAIVILQEIDDAPK